MRRFTKGLVLLAAILAIGCMVGGCESAKSADFQPRAHPDRQRLSQPER